VEILLTVGAFPVERSTAKIFFGDLDGEKRTAAAVRRLSAGASLDRATARRTIRPAPKILGCVHTVKSAVHRFEQSIAGRPYLIEVVAVAKDRWRAYIVRIPGVPTALMPFYGATPIEAADQLCDWLARAHARAASPAGTV
jgi:hypothetical protein